MHKDESFIIEYSVWANIMLIMIACAIPAAMLSVLTLIMWVWFGTTAMREHWVPFMLMYIGIPVLVLPFELINFMRLHKNCMRYTYRVSHNDIVVKNEKGDEIATIQYDDIEGHQVVDIGYSVYMAIKLYIKGGRLIVIYSTMTNYRRIQRELKLRSIPKKTYCDVRIGTYLDNVL